MSKAILHNLEIIERNTATTIGELTEGDRFYFRSDKKKIVYEVTEELDRYQLYNRINAYGYRMLNFDLKSVNSKEVIFLRHKTD